MLCEITYTFLLLSNQYSLKKSLFCIKLVVTFLQGFTSIYLNLFISIVDKNKKLNPDIQKH